MNLAAARALVLAAVLTPTVASAQSLPDDPWEPAATTSSPPPPPPAVDPGFRPVTELASAAIRFYQTDIGSRSVPRCQFALSCSRQAQAAIADEGLLIGLMRFVDRFFFRENSAAIHHYRWVRTEGGNTRLDDAVTPRD